VNCTLLIVCTTLVQEVFLSFSRGKKSKIFQAPPMHASIHKDTGCMKMGGTVHKSGRWDTPMAEQVQRVMEGGGGGVPQTCSRTTWMKLTQKGLPAVIYATQGMMGYLLVCKYLLTYSFSFLMEHRSSTRARHLTLF